MQKLVELSKPIKLRSLVYLNQTGIGEIWPAPVMVGPGQVEVRLNVLEMSCKGRKPILLQVFAK